MKDGKIYKVRSEGKFVFEVDPKTFEPKQCAYYDPFCFNERSCSGVVWIEYWQWQRKYNG